MITMPSKLMNGMSNQKAREGEKMSCLEKQREKMSVNISVTSFNLSTNLSNKTFSTPPDILIQAAHNHIFDLRRV